MDALALDGEEGRGMSAKNLGELTANFDPGVSESGNRADFSLSSHAEYIGMRKQTW
jgi:hypothetical protein